MVNDLQKKCCIGVCGQDVKERPGTVSNAASSNTCVQRGCVLMTVPDRPRVEAFFLGQIALDLFIISDMSRALYPT